jgi:hypothetical protein
MTGRPLIFVLVFAGLLLAVSDHLLSPPLQAAADDGNACAPCGAPCPN